jgi:hypothetical protein
MSVGLWKQTTYTPREIEIQKKDVPSEPGVVPDSLVLPLPAL